MDRRGMGRRGDRARSPARVPTPDLPPMLDGSNDVDAPQHIETCEESLESHARPSKVDAADVVASAPVPATAADTTGVSGVTGAIPLFSAPTALSTAVSVMSATTSSTRASRLTESYVEDALEKGDEEKKVVVNSNGKNALFVGRRRAQ